MNNTGLQKKDYNFFSMELDNKGSARKKSIRFFLLIILYLVLIAGAYYLLEQMILTTQNLAADLDSYLASEEVTSKQQELTEKRIELKKLQQFDTSLQAFSKHLEGISIIGTEYIGQITSSVPHDLYFENLSMDTHLLQIQGTAPNRQIIAEYLNNMQTLDLFQDVHISNISTITIINDEDHSVEETTYTFDMSCQLKDVIEE